MASEVKKIEEVGKAIESTITDYEPRNLSSIMMPAIYNLVAFCYQDIGEVEKAQEYRQRAEVMAKSQQTKE